MVSIIFVGIGWESRRVTHARYPFIDPFLYLLIAGCIMICLADGLYLHYRVLSDDRAFILYGCAILMYMIGQVMCRPGDKFVIWERGHPKGDHYIHPIIRYVHDGRSFLMRQTPGAILKALVLGIRDPLDLDMSKSYFTCSMTETDDILTVSHKSVIPIAFAGTEKTTIDIWKFGKKKIRDENGKAIRDKDGHVRKETRYLLHPEITIYTYVMSTQVWDKPDSFWFEKTAYENATMDAAIARSKLTRMEIAITEARYQGIADHIKDMMHLDIDGPELQEDLGSIIAEEVKRRAESQQAGDANV